MPDLPALIRTKNASETLDIAEGFAKTLKGGDIVLLHGPLGSGKTLFVRGMCRGLGMEDLWEVGSPTYTIVNSYRAGPGLFHMDLYRINHPSELDSIDFEGILAGPEIKAIEWPERISNYPFCGAGYLVSLVFSGPENKGREIHFQSFSIEPGSGLETH